MFSQSNTRTLSFSLSAAATTSAFLGCVFTAHKTLANVVNLPAAQDATLFPEDPNNSSSGPGMFVGTDSGANSGKHGLISFNIAGSIPAGSTINDVSMTLYLGMVAGSAGSTNSGDMTPRTIELHDLLTAWHGGTNGTTGISPTGNPPNYFGGTGHGFSPAATGDPTWNSSAFNISSWNTPGGDFSGTVSGSLVVARNFFLPSVWSSTNTGNAQMVADVQNWLDNPSSNDGWLLRNTDETDAQTFRAFFTREGAIEENVPGFQPMLTVDFTPAPEPTSLALIGGASTMLMMRRRRK